MTIKVPNDLGRAERRTFRSISRALADHGIDAEARRELLGDYVRLGARIAALQEVELAARGKARAAVARSMNVLASERRRMHDSLWRGWKKPPPQQVTLEMAVAAAEPESEADRAWRAFIHGEVTGTAAERDAEEAALQARYGECRWEALVNATHEEEIAENRLIAETEARHRQQPSRRARR